MSPAEAEQTKLRAAFLNSIASSSIVASVITPAVGLSIGAINVASSNFVIVATACGFWCVVGFVIHLFAVRLLGKLE
ncbi:MAG: hypothetical protein P0Y65_04890 [Candidatus Devosia phytovorans]|uniref:Uncharacterized protein n=1 Tax=Candidatus Devosia phytovorans TaxID=3121372 RepID=A0AAJ5VX89_9HYPH|nr:hypothetical protein [Devosia sp.]WEK05595.1 MAG: hypothetical protein P0Y65_04890 [Devosia sp.]